MKPPNAIVTKDEYVARCERTRRILDSNKAEETYEQILDHVRNGGSVVQLAEVWDIRYSDVAKFMSVCEPEQKRYLAACVTRGEWFDQKIVGELTAIAGHDIRELYGPNGGLLPVADWPDWAAKSVAGVESFEEFTGRGQDREKIGDTRKVKLFDKIKALELLGKNRKLFTEKVQHSLDQSLEELLSGSYQENK